MSVPTNDYRPTARLDFAWIGEAWRMFTAQPGTWIGAVALYILVTLLLIAAIAIPTGIYAYFAEIFRTAATSGGGATPPRVDTHAQALRFLPFSLMLEAIIAVLNGGLYRMAIRQYRGEAINAAGVFSAFDVAWQLIVVALVLGAVSQAVSFVEPNIGNIVSIVLEGLFFLAPIRIVDKRVGPIQALTDTLALLHGQRWLGILFYFVVYLLAMVGILACGVGTLATMPLLFLTLGVSYMMMTDPRLPAMPDYGQAIPGVWPPPPNIGRSDQ